ncbi:papain-like cysteine protease family protein [Streptomyces sp. SP17KL33]|uniref:papain-like cysteine protease family protein n=1 Tax=unclassified Streptomyces TaxID=2593676 RepID=UPI003FCCD797
MPGSMAAIWAAMRRLEPGPPTQNSVRSPNPCWAASWVMIWAYAPQSLISAESSSRANTSKRCTARFAVDGSRLTTSKDSELSGNPKNACFRRSFRFHRYVRKNQPSEALSPAAITPRMILRTSSFMAAHGSGHRRTVLESMSGSEPRSAS